MCKEHRDLAEIITLRAIALKLLFRSVAKAEFSGRDHNATSYSTETSELSKIPEDSRLAEIITLRAIALKLGLL